MLSQMNWIESETGRSGTFCYVFMSTGRCRVSHLRVGAPCARYALAARLVKLFLATVFASVGKNFSPEDRADQIFARFSLPRRVGFGHKPAIGCVEAFSSLRFDLHSSILSGLYY